MRSRDPPSEAMSEGEASVNIPSLLTLAVVSFFVIRWFLNRSGSLGPGDSGNRGRRNVVDPAHVEQISQMFPQLNTRDIIWDLQRNGGSVAATTERILTGRGLDVPPPSFQPQIALPSTVTGATPATQPASTNAAPSKANRQDLISRYNLTSRAASEDTTESAEEASGTPSSNSVWSQNKEERQRLLQKRRDDMILAARRKMMQKERDTQ